MERKREQCKSQGPILQCHKNLLLIPPSLINSFSLEISQTKKERKDVVRKLYANHNWKQFQLIL